MGKKGGALTLTSIFSRSRLSVVDGAASSPPWPWPASCRDPRTASFRGEDDEDSCSTTGGGGGGGRCGPVAARHRRLLAAGEMYRAVNSVYLDTGPGADDGDESRRSCLGGEVEVEVVEEDGFSTATAASEDWSEAVIRSLSRTTSSADRFFFDQEPASTNSILAPAPPMKPPPAVEVEQQEEERAAAPPFSGTEEIVDLLPPPPHYSSNSSSSSNNKSQLVEESVAVAVDSTDPYGDFRASMEEMVAAHGLALRGSWDALEELLAWYLRVNAKRNHPVIVRAFVDLLVGLATSPSSTTTTTSTTATSSSSSSTASTSSTKSTSTTTTTTTFSTASAAAIEQCGRGGGTEASPSSSSCSCGAPTRPAGRREAAGRVEED